MKLAVCLVTNDRKRYRIVEVPVDCFMVCYVKVVFGTVKGKFYYYVEERMGRALVKCSKEKS